MQFRSITAWALSLVAVGRCFSTAPQQDVYTTFKNQESIKEYTECPSSDALPVLRVAVVGAGVSGSSAAYFLAKARQQLADNGIPGCDGGNIPKNLHITVFERSERIGGRVLAIHPLNDSNILPLDIGASIFANVNYNMINATRKFKLHRISRTSKLQSPMGLWDGSKFVIDDFDGSRWSQWKLFWRYGKSPEKVSSL